MDLEEKIKISVEEEAGISNDISGLSIEMLDKYSKKTERMIGR